MSFVVETVYSKSPVAPPSQIDFQMVVKDGPYVRYKTDEEHRQDLQVLESVSDDQLAWIVAAMSSRINPETGQIFEEDRQIIHLAERVCRECGLRPYHSFGFQDFGRIRVTNVQATERDEPPTRRGREVIALHTTIESPNASEEVWLRLMTGKPVIAAITNDNEGKRYRDWIIPLIESSPTSDTPSRLVTFDDLSDFAIGLKRALNSPVAAKAPRV